VKSALCKTYTIFTSANKSVHHLSDLLKLTYCSLTVKNDASGGEQVSILKVCLRSIYTERDRGTQLKFVLLRPTPQTAFAVAFCINPPLYRTRTQLGGVI